MYSKSYIYKPFKYSSHYAILEMLGREEAHLKILDVGVSTGYLGKQLSEMGHTVVGIEKDREAAMLAKQHYHDLYVVDIEQFDFPSEKEFDLILFADILEHLSDPLHTLQRSLASLKKSGTIIISVPNIANIVIRLNLFLLGKFNYADRGILDRTHLRFFTLKSLQQMVREAKCEVIQLVSTPLPVQIVFPISRKGVFTILHEAHYLIVRFWKSLFSYQFVVRICPKDSP